MPVLTRKSNELICLGEREIAVTVVKVRGGTVRLGIAPPADVRIERHEASRAVATAPREPVGAGPAL